MKLMFRRVGSSFGRVVRAGFGGIRVGGFRFSTTYFCAVYNMSSVWAGLCLCFLLLFWFVMWVVVKIMVPFWVPNIVR